MDEKVELPMCIEGVATITECWTFNRLAILKTSPYYNDWIAAHYNLFVDINSYNFMFGETSCYLPEYYDAILFQEQINIFTLDKDNIVSTLKERLQKKEYIIATLRYNPKWASVHEVLLYGYDEQEKLFLSVEYAHRGFHKKVINYEEIRANIEHIREHFLCNLTAGLKMSLVYQYPITAIRMRKDFDISRCPFQTYRKLVLELNGKDIVQNSMYNFEICDDRDYAYILTGVKCLNIFRQMLEEYMNHKINSPWFKGITNAIQKIMEHQKMIAISMEYLADKWCDALMPQATQCIEEYKSTLHNVENLRNRCLKFEILKNEKILQKICEEVPALYQKQLDNLLVFVNEGFNWEVLNRKYI